LKFYCKRYVVHGFVSCSGSNPTVNFMPANQSSQLVQRLD
jgi:hypothetical protein